MKAGDLVLCDGELCVVLRTVPKTYPGWGDLDWYEVLFSTGKTGIRAPLNLEKVEP